MQQAAFLESFQCLGDRCEDTCCKGWGMQVDAATIARYQAEAPELLDAVTSGEAEHIMRRDPATDYCVKFDQGWCGIHKTRGTDFLGDACHFFPRATRQLHSMAIQTASLSCPEVVRNVMQHDAPFTMITTPDGRLPNSIRNVAPESLEPEQALAVHQAFLSAAADEAVSPARFLARLHSVAESLTLLDIASWPAAAPFYLAQADSRLRPAATREDDVFYVMQAFTGLLAAAKKTSRPRLDAVMGTMAKALNAEIDDTGQIRFSADSLDQWTIIRRHWESNGLAQATPFLRRWIQAQLSLACFPFAGFGETLSDRAVILAVRFATLELALMSTWHQHSALAEADYVYITQSLARFLDHLADPTLSIAIYRETGWVENGRLRGLLRDKTSA